LNEWTKTPYAEALSEVLGKINRMIEKTEYSNDIFTPKIKAGINYLGKM
jgi:hypothetical protein